MGETISLNGEWKYQGKEQGVMHIPGVLEQCPAERDYYGEFYLHRDIFIAEKRKGHRFLLRFHGVSYICSVYCNGILAAEHEGIWDAFETDITGMIREGKNEIGVYLRKPDFDRQSPYFFRSVLFGFIPDIMLPFGGIWKDVEIEIKNDVCFKEMKAVFRTKEKQILIGAALYHEPEEENITVETEIMTPDGGSQIFRSPYSREITCALDEIRRWDLDTPAIYRGIVRLICDGNAVDEERFTGGFRDIRIEDGEILINEKKFYMRGILHWGCYPEKMCPLPSYEEVRTELMKIKSMGFNTVKHCLYLPPEYYYELCDEMGIVIWQELPLWLPSQNEFLTARIFSQYPVMLEQFAAHPCVTIASLGCELDHTIEAETLNSLYSMLKEKMPEVIVCDNSGSGECFEGATDSHSDIYDYHFYPELYNLNELLHEFTAGYRERKPWLFGEFNDADTFRLWKGNKQVWWRDPDETKNLLRKVHKGFGSDQPVYYQSEILASYGVSEEVDGLEELSIRQMKDIRKFILETVRSFPEVKGYNITTIRDVPITASGIFDDDMRAKADGEWMAKINGGIVVAFQKDLARQWKSGGDRYLDKDRFGYFSGDRLRGRFVISNRSENLLKGTFRITLQDDTHVAAAVTGQLNVGAHEVRELAQPQIYMPAVDRTARMTLSAEAQWDGGKYENSWDVWVYPKEMTEQKVFVFDLQNILEGAEEYFSLERLGEYRDIRALSKGEVLVTTMWEKEIEEAAQRGVDVIALLPHGNGVPVVKVPFYREGVIKIMDHPAMEQTAHRGYAGIQFFGIAGECALDRRCLMKAHPGYKSLIRRYDARNFSVADYAVEYREGDGKVLMSTLNFGGGAGEQPDGFVRNRLAVKLMNDWIIYLQKGQPV